MNNSVLDKIASSGFVVAMIILAQGATAGELSKSELYYQHQHQSRNVENCSVSGASCATPVGDGCQFFSANAEGVGVDNAKRLVRDALYNMLDSRGLQVTMTSLIHEPSCYFTEVGNNVRCSIDAEICP